MTHYLITHWVFEQKGTRWLSHTPETADPVHALNLAIHELAHAWSTGGNESNFLIGSELGFYMRDLFKDRIYEAWENELLARVVQHKVLTHPDIHTELVNSKQPIAEFLDHTSLPRCVGRAVVIATRINKEITLGSMKEPKVYLEPYAVAIDHARTMLNSPEVLDLTDRIVGLRPRG